MITSTIFEILMSEGRSVLSPTQRGTGNERVKGEDIRKTLGYQLPLNPCACCFERLW